MEDITGITSKKGVDFYNIVTNDSAEFGIVRMLCSDPEKASQALQEHGYMCKIDKVVAVSISEEVGSLHNLLKAVRESFINIDYMYVSYIRSHDHPVAVLHVADLSEVENCLRSRGYVLL